MATSRYPRRGHRLAPAALSGLLRLPVSDRLATSQGIDGLWLCDLDESVWERFDAATCQALAQEVVQAVGLAVRRPKALGERILPPLPCGLRLTDLELESRTLNCLRAAGMHHRPQDLRGMTLEGLLGLRGFWVKCLIDLLTSLEYVDAHPERRRRLKSQRATDVPLACTAARYPRRGCRLAPALLEDLLREPIDLRWVVGTPLEGKRLCDLDERVWECLEADAIRRLAEVIVSRVTLGLSRRTIQERRLPRPPQGMRWEELCLENRTLNGLRRAGLAERPEELGQQTVGGLLQIKSFGAKCLVDLLSSLETLQTRPPRHLVAEVQALVEVPGARTIHFSDPRLGSLLRGLDAEANTIGGLVEQIRRRRFDPPHLLRPEAVAEVRRQVEQFQQLGLEEELTQIFAPPDAERDARIVAAYYGWDGGGGHTLEELGRTHGLSRERIRQVCVRAVKRCRGAQVFAPVLDRVLAFLAHRLPCEATRLRAEFQAAGYCRHELAFETIQQAARFLHRPVQFALVAVEKRTLVVRADQAELPRAIVQAARRLVLGYGVATVAEVAAELAAQSGKVEAGLIRATLPLLDDFAWLDRPHGWFQLESLPRYGLPNLIERVLAVTPQIEVRKLRAAIARYRRSGRRVPPARVLREFCRRLSWVRVEGNRVVADPPQRWETVLRGTEASLVRILETHGPVLERGLLEEYCLAEGVNRFSFNAMVMGSPVIAQYGRSLYGLIGASLDRETLQSLTAPRPENLAARVLRGFGQTEEGQVYLAYRLSKAAISGGVITVPAAMKEALRGRFTLRTDGGDLAGTLVSKSGCAWGLGPALRSQNAQPGDPLLLVLDPHRREAELRLGEAALQEAVVVD